MTRLGFLLDSSSCIGCHACTVACKAEHDVALGVNRTWVKYIETGTFPDAERHFSVMRCNHCDNAPCITICPTGALFRASNGVVDFDDDNCIGCKGCMNACPYDALYINPATNTAHKCNFCNHRIEQNLEPSCVVVCPTHAIKVADLDDPNDAVTQLIVNSPTAVRAPEQQTLPKVHYLGASQASLDPLRSAIASDGMIWADTTPQHPTMPTGTNGTEARTTYTTAHETTWKGRVASYLVTKAAAAGVMAIAAVLVLVGHGDAQAAVAVMPALVAGALLVVTGALLIGDLRRPERFYYLLTRPNKRSWLVKGAWVLGGFAAVCALWLAAAAADSSVALGVLVAPAIVGAAATAGYTAFLFNQCEGRDLWQSKLVLPVLLVQGAVAGASVYLLADPVMHIPAVGVVHWVMLGGLTACGVLIAAEFVFSSQTTSQSTSHVKAALSNLARGSQARRFWVGAIGLGLIVPAIVMSVAVATASGSGLPAVAAVSAMVGMWFYEDSFVRAGQSVPLS